MGPQKEVRNVLLGAGRRGSLLGHGRSVNKTVSSYMQRRKCKRQLGYMAKAQWVEVAQCGEHNIMNLDCFEHSVGADLGWEALLMGALKQGENFRETLIALGEAKRTANRFLVAIRTWSS